MPFFDSDAETQITFNETNITGSNSSKAAVLIAGVSPTNTGSFLKTSELGELNIVSGIVVSALNSTTSALDVTGSFVGEAEDVTLYQEIDISLAGAPATNASGTLFYEFSPDGVNWDVSVSRSLDSPNIVTQFLRVILPFFRVRYENDNTALTEFRLTTVFHKSTSTRLTRYLDQEIDNSEPVQNVRAAIVGDRPDGTFGNVPITRNNFLKTELSELGPELEERSIAGDKALLGAAVGSNRITKVFADFTLSLASNAVSSSVSGSGGITESTSFVDIESGTGTHASASLFTDNKILFTPGQEIYGQFTTAFTTPTHPSSSQRAGLFGETDGVFLGYSGSNFGITIRSGSIDTFVSSANFNSDLLNGNSNSRYTRNNIPEEIDFTQKNNYRIRYNAAGGADPVVFEIMAPDGQWVTYHKLTNINQSKFPVTSNPSQRIRIEVIKDDSDATNLKIRTNSWDGGTVESPVGFGNEDVKGNKYVTANVASATADETIYTVSADRILKVTTIIIIVRNSSIATAGRLDIRDGGAAGDIRLPATMTGTGTDTGTAQLEMAITFPTPLKFTTDVFADIVSGTLTYSITIVGYETRQGVDDV